MSFLPIAHREIRLAALRPATYYMRSAAVVVPLIFLTYLVFFTEAGSFNALRLGPNILTMISSVAFTYCLFAGAFFTSDCISSERRDGTIGLLFLTKLRAYDITAGKLIAQSIPSFYGLVAGIPILAFSMLFGGVTQNQFLQTAFTLLTVLVLSLSVGMFSSAIYRDNNRSVMLTMLILVTMCFGFPFVDRFLNGLIPGYKVEHYLLLSSPFVLLKTAWGGNALLLFWPSVGILWSCSALAFGAATFYTSRWNRREPRESNEPSTTPPATENQTDSSRAPASLRRGRFRIGIRDPYIWLAKQSFSRTVSQWLLFGGGSLALMVMFLQPSTMFIGIALYSLIPFHILFKTLLAIEAARSLNTARRAGLLELLMVTPNPIQNFPRAMHLALTRNYSPLSKFLVTTNVVALLGFFFEFIIRSRADWGGFFLISQILLGGILILYIDRNSITWLALRAGLRYVKPSRGALVTMGRAMGLSWIGLLLLFGFLAGISPEPMGAVIFVFIWQVATICDVLAAGQSARRDLNRNFAQYYHCPK